MPPSDRKRAARPIGFGLWALLLALAVRAGGDVTAVVSTALFLIGSLAAPLQSSSSRTRVRSAGALLLVAPWFAVGAYGWMDVPLGARCHECTPHFCFDGYAWGDGSAELGWQRFLPAVLVGLLAASSAAVGDRALRAMRAHARRLVLAAFTWAALSLVLLFAHAARTTTREQYIADLPPVATVAPQSATEPEPSETHVAAIGIVARSFPGDRQTTLSLKRGDEWGSCGFAGASGRIGVHHDTTLGALFFVPEHGAAVACTESDLQCGPIGALAISHRLRPSRAWFIWAAVGLACAAALQIWRTLRARALVATPRRPVLGVYREPQYNDGARSRLQDKLLALDGWTIVVLVMSSPPLPSMLLVHLGWWPR